MCEGGGGGGMYCKYVFELEMVPPNLQGQGERKMQGEVEAGGTVRKGERRTVAENGNAGYMTLREGRYDDRLGLIWEVPRYPKSLVHDNGSDRSDIYYSLRCVPGCHDACGCHPGQLPSTAMYAVGGV